MFPWLQGGGGGHGVELEVGRLPSLSANIHCTQRQALALGDKS